MALLEIDNLHVFYGQIHALRGVTLNVDKDRIITLIGANGAGKTTMLNAVSSILAAAEGSITFADEDINELSPHHVVGKGVVQVPEGRRIFGRLSVHENLRMGAFLRSDKAGIRESEEQMLAMARALMSQPTMLLLDEPSMGLAPMLVQQIFETVQEIRKQGVSVLLVEQNAFMALQIADYGYVMETGEIVLEGDANKLLDDDSVKEAYLG
jgi:branched-chain amino acid transport system ATP-binding protein